MKQCLSLLLFCAFAWTSKGQDGYQIQFDLKGAPDSKAYLAYYYGKAMPTVYVIDSVDMKQGRIHFESKEKLVGGIYMIIYNQREAYFEFILENGDRFKAKGEHGNLPLSLAYEGSQANESFIGYMRFLDHYGKRRAALGERLSTAATFVDSLVIQGDMQALQVSLDSFRQEYGKQHPDALLSKIFASLEIPTVPPGPHFLEDGKTIDSAFGFYYMQRHYWDSFPFDDERIVFTPVMENKLNDYFQRYVAPVPDSVMKAADELLKKARASAEVFKYSLHFLAQYTESSKIMGMDKAFVHLVENYYQKGEAFWLSAEAVDAYIDRARKIAPNLIGNLAPELRLPDREGNFHSLHGMEAPYTILVFWSPDCGGCLTEMPRVDSLYRAVLKEKGVKIYAVRTEGEPDHWQKMIQEKGIGSWTHVYDPERRSNFRSLYDIYGTPVIYLLDDRKIIRGKRLSVANIAELIDHLESRKHEAKAPSKG